MGAVHPGADTFAGEILFEERRDLAAAFIQQLDWDWGCVLIRNAAARLQVETK